MTEEGKTIEDENKYHQLSQTVNEETKFVVTRLPNQECFNFSLT